MKAFIYKRSGLLMLLWALVIFILCSTPGRYIPSNEWLDILSVDKLVHATMFFILCSLSGLFAVKSGWGRGAVLLLALLCITYGGLIEILQARVFSQRSGDWNDFIANSFGCLVSLLLSRRMAALKF